MEASSSATNFLLSSLLDLAVPEIYSQNAFSLLELPNVAGDRDLSRRREWMEKAAKSKLPVPAGPVRWLPRTPPPDENEIRLAAHSIQDAECRFVHEFFWFWPLKLGGTANDQALQLFSQGKIAGANSEWNRSAKAKDTEGAAAQHNLYPSRNSSLKNGSSGPAPAVIKSNHLLSPHE